jgi:hypothetical protein
MPANRQPALLEPGQMVTVHLLKPAKGVTVTYQGVLVLAERGHLLLHARWERPKLDLGYVTFEPGDHFLEHYFTDRWFNIFEIRGLADELKGWYCNVTRPVQIDGTVITSEDLELDLFVAPDRQQLLRLDEDEFEARNFLDHDPAAHAAALTALGELEQMASAGTPPFDHT